MFFKCKTTFTDLLGFDFYCKSAQKTAKNVTIETHNRLENDFKVT